VTAFAYIADDKKRPANSLQSVVGSHIQQLTNECLAFFLKTAATYATHRISVCYVFRSLFLSQEAMISRRLLCYSVQK
jgi:hypothetical protein